MVCLGFEPGAARWWAQTKPRTSSGRPAYYNFILEIYILGFGREQRYSTGPDLVHF